MLLLSYMYDRITALLILAWIIAYLRVVLSLIGFRNSQTRGLQTTVVPMCFTTQTFESTPTLILAFLHNRWLVIVSAAKPLESVKTSAPSRSTQFASVIGKPTQWNRGLVKIIRKMKQRQARRSQAVKDETPCTSPSKSLIPSIYAVVSLFRQVGMINAVKRQKRQWRRRLLHNRQDDSWIRKQLSSEQ